MKTIVFGHNAEKDFARLDHEARAAVRHALYGYAITGVGDVKRLKASDFFRLRVGRYRVVFAEDLVTIIAIYVGKRETTTYAKGRV